MAWMLGFQDDRGVDTRKAPQLDGFYVPRFSVGEEEIGWEKAIDINEHGMHRLS